MSKLFSGIIGFSIGVFGCVITLPIATTLGWPSMQLLFSIITSLTIAGAAVAATNIHYSSHRQQKAARIWDINKDVLLELALSLHEVIESTKTEINKLRATEIDELRAEDGGWDSGDELATKRSNKRNTNVWETLDEKIRYALNVYQPLMADSLIELIRTYQATGDRITEGVIDYDYDSLSAYEEMLIEGKNLHVKLKEFIGEVSGIRKP